MLAREAASPIPCLSSQSPSPPISSRPETGCMKATLSRIADVLDGKRLASFAANLAV